MNTEINKSEPSTLKPKNTENEIIIPGLHKEENSTELSQLKQTSNNINQEDDDDNDDDLSKKKNLTPEEEMIIKQRNAVIQNNENDEEYVNNDYNRSFVYHKIGNCHCFFANHFGDPYFIIGPQWPMFFLLTFFINGIVLFFIFKFGDTYTFLYKSVGIIFLLFFQITFTYTFIINPGFPKNDFGRQNGIPKEKYKFCTECKFFYNIDKNVNHCYDCGICIEGYDHHCPWTSKCIGNNNLYSFYCFMTGILLNFGYAVVCLTTMKR